MLDGRGWLVTPVTTVREHLFINCVILYAYYSIDITDGNRFAILLEFYVIILLVLVAQIYTKKIPAHGKLVLARKWCISPKKALNMIWFTTQYGTYTVLQPSLAG